ncbi:MAG: hypothetical protein PHC51_06305 [bacterium]|nr:hypothetical protein [bacterium]
MEQASTHIPLRNDIEENIHTARLSHFSEVQTANTALWDLPKMLRRLGGLILCASTVIFVSQNALPLDSLNRFYAFTAFLLLLFLTGLISGLKLMDKTTARLSFLLSLLFLGPQFLQLGGIVRATLIGVDLNAPSVFLLKDVSLPSMALAVATGLSMVALFSWFTYGFTCSEERKKLTLLHTVMLVTLLLPFRETHYVLPVMIALFAATLTFSNRYLAPLTARGTFEGKMTELSLYLPVILLSVRQLGIHGSDALFIAVSSLILSHLFLIGSAMLSGLVAKMFSYLALIPMMIAATAVTLDSGFSPDTAFGIAVSQMIFFVLTLFFARYSTLSKKCFNISSTSLTIAALFLLGDASIGYSIMAVVIATALSIFGYQQKNSYIFRTSSLAMGWTLIYHLRFAADIYAMSPWLTLAALGLSLTMASSLLSYNSKRLQSVQTLIFNPEKYWNESL